MIPYRINSELAEEEIVVSDATIESAMNPHLLQYNSTKLFTRVQSLPEVC